MTSFDDIAVPHRDILEGNLTLETYAAKLLDVYNKSGSADYVDPNQFFERTYETKNLSAIVKAVKSRLDGEDVDHFYPLQTRFGGGKTHTLIYLYHKFMDWYKKKPVVIVGSELDPNKHTIWGEIERQLTGSVSKLTSRVSHGSAAIRPLLDQSQPVLILIDELLHYVGRADGVSVGKSTLAEQTIAFVQELGDAVTDIKNACVVVTLPSSASEQIGDERVAAQFAKLKNFAGRIADVGSPVDDAEVPSIIRRRLFQTGDAEIAHKAAHIIDAYVAYCEEEGILPEEDKAAYRKRFERSYPFHPQVIDVLYRRWGSLQNFQRTRGVLRLLTIVVHMMLKSGREFISLGDFDLKNNRLREELVQYMDEQFQSVIAQDIVGSESGAAKVDALMPPDLVPKKLGTRAASTIFMYSHSGYGATRNEQTGATEADIMRSAASSGIPSANISTVIEKFRSHMFYLAARSGTYLFTKEPNLLKMKLEKMENVTRDELAVIERQLLQKHVLPGRFAVCIWPTNSRMVKDSDAYTLAVLKEPDVELMRSILNNAGSAPRKYRNSVFFLTVLPMAKVKFQNAVKSKIAWDTILKKVSLNDEQRTMVKDELQQDTNKTVDFLKEYYSCLYVPDSGNPLKPSPGGGAGPTLEMHEITVPIYTSMSVDQIVYDYLRQESLFVERIGPEFIAENYMASNPKVSTLNLYESMLTSPGEIRPASRKTLSDAIRSGVEQKMFGLGTVGSGAYKVRHFGDTDDPAVTFSADEVIIAKGLCGDPPEPEPSMVCGICGATFETAASFDDHAKKHRPAPNSLDSLEFTFTLPLGTANYASDMFLLIADRFKDIRLTLSATNGYMSPADIENVKETLRQMESKSDLFEKHDARSPFMPDTVNSADQKTKTGEEP